MKLKDIITLLLLEYLGQSQQGSVIIPNYFLGYWECDIISIGKNDYITEYEVKTNKIDFKKDFDKEYVEHNYRDEHGFFRWDRDPKTIVHNKHVELSEGKRVNKFVFVAPKGLLKAEELPYHAGLLEYNENSFPSFQYIKNPKFLHKEKISEKEIKAAMKKMYSRYYYAIQLPAINKFREKLYE